MLEKIVDSRRFQTLRRLGWHDPVGLQRDRSGDCRSLALPDDLEAQDSQALITLHSEEYLGASDRGVVAVRRMYDAQLKAVAEGRDPACVNFQPGSECVEFTAGSLISPPNMFSQKEITDA